jgi:hypothetical protein
MNLFKVIKNKVFPKKSTWDFEDYPVKTWKNPNAGEKKVAYGAGISNWSLMVGHGENEQQAIKALKEKFNLYKENNKDIPKPGEMVPIKFATTENISKYEDIAVDFFKRILNLDYYEGFYSDSSSLPDFEPSQPEDSKKMKDEIIKRTLSIYGIDISSVYGEPLFVVFETKNHR